jgi:rhamnogalacturonyl hydrolase YesR
VTDFSRVDHIEAGRVAFELSQRHGRSAYQHAAKLAAEVLAKGDTEEHGFWRYIEAALRPRSEGT